MKWWVPPRWVLLSQGLPLNTLGYEFLAQFPQLGRSVFLGSIEANTQALSQKMAESAAA